MRVARALCLVPLLLLVACKEEEPAAPCPDGPETCVCTKSTDCGKAGEWACAGRKCLKLCRTAADCGQGMVCEELQCAVPACGGDAECPSGQHCLGGSCQAPAAGASVAGCSVQPPRALLRAGSARGFQVHARDAQGRGVPYKGTVTWSVDKAARATVAGTGVAVQVTGGTEEGAVSVGAAIPGGPTCTAATAQVYGPVPEGKLRVVVADLQSAVPIADAKVVVRRAASSSEATTDATGAALLDKGAAEARTVSVFHVLHAYVTLVGVHADDLVVYAKPFPSRAGFKGELTAAAFADLPQQDERVHMAIFGSSLPGNVLDLQAPTLFGELTPTPIAFGSQQATVPLPSGVVLGLDDTMYKGAFDVFAAPGLRALWGLGGNANFNDLVAAMGPLLASEGKLNTAEMVRVLLPMLNRFHSGVLTGRTVPATAELEPVTIPLTTPLRLKLNVQVPELPVTTAGGAGVELEAAAVLGGALLPGQGLVPLGLVAGVDKDTDTETADRKVNNPDPGGSAGVLPLNLAPRYGGLENGRYAVMAAAVSYGTVGLTEEENAPTLLSGLVAMPDTLAYNAERASFSFGRSFLGLPAAPALSGRTFTLGGAVEGARLHRLDIGSAWGGEWYVYFPPGVESVQVPEVPAGWDDRTKVPAGTDPLQVLIQSASFNTAGETLDYEKVFAFGGDDMDDLTLRLDAFSTRQVIVP